MLYDSLTIRNWQQIREVDLRFHDRLTVLTGANGSGKTTLLRMLGRQFGWQYHQLGTPKKKKGEREFRFLVDLWDRIRESSSTSGQEEIGSISYSDGSQSSVTVPREPGSAQYRPNISPSRSVEGLFLPADRPEFTYSQVKQIPTQARTGHDAFNYVSNNLRSRVMNARGKSPSQAIKEVLIGLAFLGYPSRAVDGDPEARETYEGFQDALRRVLPDEIGFEEIEVRSSQGSTEIVLVTDTGEFLLGAVSGGISALFTLTWLVYMYSSGLDSDQRFSVIIDEPETHLHPALQRDLLPNLSEAFPQARFIVATHSPLVVGSVKDSTIVALVFEEDRVVSKELDLENKVGTANAVLRDVLGVPATMPIWVEKELKALASEFEDEPLTEESVRHLRARLSEMGLEQWVPELLSDAIRERQI